MIFVRRAFILRCLLCTHLLVVEIWGDTVGMRSVTYWFWRFVPYCLFLVLVAYYARPVARLDWKTLFMVLFLFSFFLTFLVGVAGRLEIFSGISFLRPTSSSREAIFSYLRLVSMFSFLAGSYFTLREIYQTKSELSQEVVRQRETEQALQRQLDFDNLIAEFLSRLAWSFGPEIDACMRTSLGQIAEFVGAEHAFVILLSADSGTWSVSHEWCAEGIPRLMEKYQPIAMGGIRAWSEEKLKAGEVVQINRLEDIPPEASLIRQQAESEGVKSRLTVPLLGQGNLLIGSIVLQTYSHEQRWSQEDIRQLRLVAESFVNVFNRQQAEISLRQSENRYRTLFESAQDAIFLMQGDRFMDCNPHTLRMFGCCREQIIGETPVRFSPVLQSDGCDSAWKAKEKIQAAIAGVPQYFEWRHCRHDGTVFDVEVSLNRIELNEQSMLLAIVRDITERKQAEEALRFSEERFAKAFQASPEPISIYRHSDGMLMEVNERWTSTYGYTRGEAIGRTSLDLDLVNLEDRQRLRRQLEERSSVREFEIDLRSKQGDVRNVSLSAEHIMIHGEPCNIFLHRDITEHKRAEQRLRATSEQLRALTASVTSAREEEGIRIAREIHDELGSALTSLRWDLEGIDRVISGSEDQSHLVAVRDKIAVMMRLTDTTIGVVRRISSELRPSVLDDIGLVEAIEWHTEQFQAQRGIVCQCDCAVENLVLNQEQSTAMFRIFQEALTNILRHAHATRINITMEEIENEFILTIRDNGKGIREDQKSGLHSLGILGMRERAHLIGGQIDITGFEGEGTVVTVRVPISQ